MGFVTKLFGMIDISTLKLKKGKKEEKRSLLKEVISKPEDFKLEAYIEGEEIIIHVKRKES